MRDRSSFVRRLRQAVDHEVERITRARKLWDSCSVGSDAPTDSVHDWPVGRRSERDRRRVGHRNLIHDALAPVLGQAVKAFVVLERNVVLSLSEIAAVCQRSLATASVPTHVQFLPSLPKGVTGKIDKTALASRKLVLFRS
jgi:acyl-CoA synthetase (AMP-forming)/AMP-acid ligase II